VREFLSDNEIPFEDRNIRRSEAARDELAARSRHLIVPQLFWRDHHVVGYDPAALEEVARAYRDGAT
jgi:glutaredoxin